MYCEPFFEGHLPKVVNLRLAGQLLAIELQHLLSLQICNQFSVLYYLLDSCNPLVFYSFFCCLRSHDAKVTAEKGRTD